MPTKTSAGLVDALKLLAVMPAAGAGIGGLIGAARAEKGKRLRTAVGDAGVGALAGLGFGLGGLSGGAAGMTLGSAGHPSVAEQNSAALGGAGSALGAVGAGMLGQKLRKEMEEEYDNNSMGFADKIGKDVTKTMKKTAFDDLQNVALGTSPQQAPTIGQGALAGAGIGGLIGALRAPKGKMLKYTLGGAGIGGLTGAGSTAAYRFHDSLNMPQPYNSLSRLPVTIGAGGLAAHLGNKMYDEVEGYIPEKKQDKKDDKKDKPMKKTEKKSAALSFGEKVAAGFDWKSILNSGLGGAALGAGVGGLAGLVAPGEDGQGRRRSRLSGALRGAMGGGLLGGGAGAIGEAASPGFGQSAYNYANDMYKQLFGRPNPVRGQQVASTLAPMPGGQQMRVHPGTKSLEQIQAERAPMMDAILNKPEETVEPISFPGMN